MHLHLWTWYYIPTASRCTLIWLHTSLACTTSDCLYSCTFSPLKYHWVLFLISPAAPQLECWRRMEDGFLWETDDQTEDCPFPLESCEGRHSLANSNWTRDLDPLVKWLDWKVLLLLLLMDYEWRYAVTLRCGGETDNDLWQEMLSFVVRSNKFEARNCSSLILANRTHSTDPDNDFGVTKITEWEDTMDGWMDGQRRKSFGIKWRDARAWWSCTSSPVVVVGWQWPRCLVVADWIEMGSHSTDNSQLFKFFKYQFTGGTSSIVRHHPLQDRVSSAAAFSHGQWHYFLSNCFCCDAKVTKAGQAMELMPWNVADYL